MGEISMGRIMKMGNRANEHIVDGIITLGLNLLVAPKEEASSFSLHLVLCTAGGREFLGRKTSQSRVFYFSLENGRDETRQKIADIMDGNTDPVNITVVYILDAFGDNIEDGMDIYLHDNRKTKLIVIDSLEKTLENDAGQVEYNYAFEKLCDLKKIALKNGVAVLVVAHEWNPKDSDRLADIADTRLEIVKSGEEYTLFISETKVDVEVDAGRWNRL